MAGSLDGTSSRQGQYGLKGDILMLNLHNIYVKNTVRYNVNLRCIRI